MDGNSSYKIARLIPITLIVSGLTIITILSVYFSTNQKTNLAPRAAKSTTITVQGSVEKLPSCLTQLICYDLISADGNRYHLYGKRYPKITSIKGGNAPLLVVDFDQYLNKEVKVSGFLITGEYDYIILTNIELIK